MGIYLLIGDALSRTSIISTDDLAVMAVDSVTNTAACNQVLAVGGPEILKREDIPQIFSRVYQREAVVINPPLAVVDGLRSLIGVFNQDAQKSFGTFRTLLNNEFFCTPAETELLESIFKLKLETLESFLRRN